MNIHFHLFVDLSTVCFFLRYFKSGEYDINFDNEILSFVRFATIVLQNLNLISRPNIHEILYPGNLSELMNLCQLSPPEEILHNISINRFLKNFLSTKTKSKSV
jgi:hypothetical protein